MPADARALADDPERVSWLRFDEFERVFDETRAKHVLGWKVEVGFAEGLARTVEWSRHHSLPQR